MWTLSRIVFSRMYHICLCQTCVAYWKLLHQTYSSNTRFRPGVESGSAVLDADNSSVMILIFLCLSVRLGRFTACTKSSQKKPICGRAKKSLKQLLSSSLINRVIIISQIKYLSNHSPFSIQVQL